MKIKIGRTNISIRIFGFLVFILFMNFYNNSRRVKEPLRYMIEFDIIIFDNFFRFVVSCREPWIYQERHTIFIEILGKRFTFYNKIKKSIHDKIDDLA